MPICADCNKEKPSDDFVKDKYAPRGHKSYCYECDSIRKLRRKINKMTNEQKNNHLVVLIVDGKTVLECSKYFQWSIDEIIEKLSVYNYDSNNKWCPQCRMFKPLTEFTLDKHNKHGVKSWCKNCWSEYNNHPDIKQREKERFKNWYSTDEGRAQKLKDSKEYYERNKDKRIAYMKSYYENNKDKKSIWVRNRQMLKKKAIPLWADLDAIKYIYLEAKRLESLDGIKRHVDHIVPLNHPLVCGLHVQHNLQILTAEQNLSKSNHFIAG